MNVAEFYNIIKDIDIDGELVSVHFDGNYSGQIRKVKNISNKIVLSAEFDPYGEISIDFSDLRDEVEKFALSDPDYEVVYAVPSKGTYEIVGVAKNHYDYRWDGDDEYDCCDIQCGERLCGGKDEDIKNCFINPDDYENFFENKKLRESNMKELYADIKDEIVEFINRKDIMDNFDAAKESLINRLADKYGVAIEDIESIYGDAEEDVFFGDEFFESLIKMDKPLKEGIDEDYFTACYRAEKVVNSFEKTYGKEMTMRAFMKQFEDIDF